jgi:hypothetical protein
MRLCLKFALLFEQSAEVRHFHRGSRPEGALQAVSVVARDRHQRRHRESTSIPAERRCRLQPVGDHLLLHTCLDGSRPDVQPIQPAVQYIAVVARFLEPAACTHFQDVTWCSMLLCVLHTTYQRLSRGGGRLCETCTPAFCECCHSSSRNIHKSQIRHNIVRNMVSFLVCEGVYFWSKPFALFALAQSSHNCCRCCCHCNPDSIRKRGSKHFAWRFLRGTHQAAASSACQDH